MKEQTLSTFWQQDLWALVAQLQTQQT